MPSTDSVAAIRRLAASYIQRAEIPLDHNGRDPRHWLARVFSDDDLFSYFIDPAKFANLIRIRTTEDGLRTRFDLDGFRVPQAHLIPMDVYGITEKAPVTYDYYRKYRVQVIDAAVKAILALRARYRLSAPEAVKSKPRKFRPGSLNNWINNALTQLGNDATALRICDWLDGQEGEIPRPYGRSFVQAYRTKPTDRRTAPFSGF